MFSPIQESRLRPIATALLSIVACFSAKAAQAPDTVFEIASLDGWGEVSCSLANLDPREEMESLQMLKNSLGAIDSSGSRSLREMCESLQAVQPPLTFQPLADREAFSGIVPRELESLLVGWHNDIKPLLLSPSNWPEIHRRARYANVPILMYHDILPEKEVFFDVTPEELEAHFQRLQELGATPIGLPQLIAHLRTGIPLPDKPVILSFDDGYGGHYKYVYPLMKKYGYPATFSIYTNKMSLKGGRTAVTWEQLQEMAKDPLVTITSHSISHPQDLRKLSDEDLQTEVFESKRLLEEGLGIPIRYFTYPVGHWDDRVRQVVADAGYEAALAMNDLDNHYAGDSPDLLTLGRFGQSQLERAIAGAQGGFPVTFGPKQFDFTTPITKEHHKVKGAKIILVTGGRPETIHADTRGQVPDIIEGTGAEAAVDGAFFSLRSLNSNDVIGPTLSKKGQQYAPGDDWENERIAGRPLVLIDGRKVKFVPFDTALHSTREGIVAEMPSVTDAFVGAAWLVRDGVPQRPEDFGTLFDFDAARNRAFWGFNHAGQPVIGVTENLVDSVRLGEALFRLGLRDVVMLDSGGSTSLAYQGESAVSFVPRPVPHVVALYPPLPGKTTEAEQARLRGE